MAFQARGTMRAALLVYRGGAFPSRPAPWQRTFAQEQSLPFSTRTRQNRDELGIQTPFDNNSITFSKAGPRSLHEQHQRQQSVPENREATQTIKNMARKRDWQAAWAEFKGLEKPDPFSYNAILHAADMCNKYHEAFQIYADMRSAEIAMSAVTYSPLIRLAGRSRKIEQAESLVDEMQKAGIASNAHIYAARIEAYKFARDSQSALNVWREMQKAGMPVNGTTLCCVLAAVAQSGNIALTESLFGDAPAGLEVHIAHYNCLLLACRKAGDVDAAQRVLRDLREKGLKPDVISYTSLLMAFRVGGRPIDGLDHVLDVMSKEGISADGFFVEERVACTLCVPGQSDLRVVVTLEDYPRQALIKSSEIIRDARLAGVKLTNFTIEFDARAGQFLQAAAPVALAGDPSTPTDWVRVVSAQQPAEGQKAEYYWDRLSGKTQWELPAGSVTATLTA